MIIPTTLIHKNWKGFALYPFIFARPEYVADEIFLNHERIHLAQQKELWLLGFYPWYLWELLRVGYRKSMFEREAYKNQYNPGYLKTRPKFNFKNY